MPTCQNGLPALAPDSYLLCTWISRSVGIR